jgi:hypothetical protein
MKIPNEVYCRRRPLEQTVHALKRGSLKIGFIGGSITEDRPIEKGHHNWPETLISWLQAHHPELRLSVENVAIGATGSDLAVFRARRDLLDRSCDLIFVEFAVNDHGTPSERRNRTREGLLRQLLAAGTADVVLIYTFCQEMYADMEKGKMPSSIAEFELLAKHYDLSSLWVGLQALREVKAGQMRWEEWLPDGLHPEHRGSLSYGQCATGFLEKELNHTQGSSGSPAKPKALPSPRNKQCWERVHLLPLSEIRRQGPWVLRRWSHYSWIDQVLSTAAPGARLSFSFTGRGLALGFDFGKTSAEFRYRINGGKWQTSLRDRPSWCPVAGWLRLFVVEDQLTRKKHQIELEVIHGNRPECTGTTFDLGLVGVID